MFQDYVRRELKWTTDMYYTVTAQVRPWDQGQPGGPAEVVAVGHDRADVI